MAPGGSCRLVLLWKNDRASHMHLHANAPNVNNALQSTRAPATLLRQDTSNYAKLTAARSKQEYHIYTLCTGTNQDSCALRSHSPKVEQFIYTTTGYRRSSKFINHYLIHDHLTSLGTGSWKHSSDHRHALSTQYCRTEVYLSSSTPARK